MGVWHGTYANLLRTRFSALVAYAEALVDDRAAARGLAQDASVAVFARRKSPRDIQSAEIAAREWMATKAVADGVSAEHVATVLFALDGRTDDGIRAILKKTAPDPLPNVSPQQSDAIRSRFAETAAVYSTPSGGVNTVMEPARQRHRSALISAAAGTAAAVAVVAVGGWFGLNHLPAFPGNAAAPTPSGSPSDNLLAVTWDPKPQYDAAMAGFHYPECGEKFDPKPQAVGGVTPKPQVQVDPSRRGDEIAIFMGDIFVSDDGANTPLLAEAYRFVVTKDGVVVYSDDYRRDEFRGLSYFTVNEGATNSFSGGIGFSGTSMCDARVAGDKLDEKMDGLSSAEQDKLWNKFVKKWGKIKPGVYEVYTVTPMVFGEQAALGRAFALEGIGDTASLTDNLAYSPLAQDPRMIPFCSGSMDFGDFSCDPPPDVLTEVLTRKLDPANITGTDIAPGIGISEPVEITVE